MISRERRERKRRTRRLLARLSAVTVPLRPAARVGAHWRAEGRTIALGLPVHGISALTGLVAGLVLAGAVGMLQRFPGLILVVLASNGLRGMIFGSFGARLGTAIALGEYEPTLSRGSALRINVAAAAVLTMATAPLLAVLAWLGSFLFVSEVAHLSDFLVIAILGGAISALAVGIFTVAVVAACATWSWDLDTVAAPLVTMAGDVVGVPSIVIAALLAGHGWPTFALAFALTAFSIGVLVGAPRRMQDRASRIVWSSLPVLGVVTIIDLSAGGVLQAQGAHFFSSGAILVMLPAFLEALGGFGGMYASRLGTKFHLGVIETRYVPRGLAWLDSTLVVLLAVLLLPLMAIGANGLAILTGTGSAGIGAIVEIAMVAGIIATVLAILVGYYVAFFTVQWSLDPDDHALPIVTAVMDLLGVLCLAFTLNILR